MIGRRGVGEASLETERRWLRGFIGPERRLKEAFRGGVDGQHRAGGN
jgi:hypothetical protein